MNKVWLNGTAGSPLIYDFRWGGVVTCGCAYKKGKGCTNGIGPYECPGLSDPGMNFGLGFYNDHHFHFGEGKKVGGGEYILRWRCALICCCFRVRPGHNFGSGFYNDSYLLLG